MKTENLQPENPPAFPLFIPEADHANEYNAQGMTLRDYFAAKIIQGKDIDCHTAYYKDFAENAYLMADEMLKARNK